MKLQSNTQRFVVTPVGCFILFLMTVACNQIVGTNTSSKGTIQQKEQPNFKQESLYLFNWRLGNTTFFSGTTSSITVLNRDTIEKIELEPLTATIKHVKDTLIPVANSLQGHCTMSIDDVQDWLTASFHFVYPNTFVLGAVFREYMDSASYALIAHACSTNAILTLDQKNTIVSCVATAIQSNDFFKRFRKKFEDEVLLSEMHYLIQRLRNEQIMLDSFGTIKENLSTYQQEIVHWFNVDLLLRFLDNPTAAERLSMFKVNPKAQRIHKFEFTETVLNSKNYSIERFFAINSEGIQQLGYRDTFRYHELAAQQISPFSFTTDKNFEVTPLFFPSISKIKSQELMACLVSGQALIQYHGKTSTLDTALYELKTYYIIDGEFKESDRIVRLAGTITTAFYFCHQPNISNLTKIADLLKYNTQINVRRMVSGGDTLLYWEEKKLHTTRIAL